MAFITGFFALWIAVGSPLASMDHHWLTAHMVQHLLLMTVAAPLILLGLPTIPLRPPHPVFCWLAGTSVVIGWHVPALFELGMSSVLWHAIEQASFFAAGILFWWPIVQSGPSHRRLSPWGAPLYLFLATLPCDTLSAFLTFCDRVVYPHYKSANALRDQECAGALMWVWVTFVYLAPAVAITLRALSPRQPALDAVIVRDGAFGIE
jgi:putative membrane protein